MIADSLLQEIVAANDIVETVSSYVTLKKAGKDHKGLCPFHGEKTPSFTVSTIKQIFYCFGCGAGGDVIGFVMRMEKIEFPEALEFLAQKKGIVLPSQQRGGESDVKKTRLFDIHKAVSQFFCGNLRAERVPQDYLRSRGIEGLSARDFSLGWAMPRWDSLLDWGRARGYSVRELTAAGLILSNEEQSDRHHDRFRGRVIFPMFDLQGRVIAFSGRTLVDGQPKYINSPETAIFRKGSTLFGLCQAKEAIGKAGWVAVCEGPLDMISVFQAGIRNVVASQGTAFTERHAKLLKRFTERVILCFDGDQAGKMATLRSLEVFLAEGMDVRIAVLPPKEDPDSYVRGHGKQAFLDLLQGALDYLTFRFGLLKSAHDTATEIGKGNAAREILSELVRIPDAVYQDTCIQRLAELLGVRAEALWLELKNSQRPGRAPLQDTVSLSVSHVPWELDWVAAVVQDEELLRAESQNEHFEMLSDPTLAGVVRTAVGQWRQSAYRGVGSVSVLFRGGRGAEVLAQIASRPVNAEAGMVYEEGLLRFRRRNLQVAIRELTRKIRSLEESHADTGGHLARVSDMKRELLDMDRVPARGALGT